MSFAPMDFPGSHLLHPACDDDCECPTTGLGSAVLLALVEGAAPILAAYVLNRISMRRRADEDEQETDE